MHNHRINRPDRLRHGSRGHRDTDDCPICLNPSIADEIRELERKANEFIAKVFLTDDPLEKQSHRISAAMADLKKWQLIAEVEDYISCPCGIDHRRRIILQKRTIVAQHILVYREMTAA